MVKTVAAAHIDVDLLVRKATLGLIMLLRAALLRTVMSCLHAGGTNST